MLYHFHYKGEPWRGQIYKNNEAGYQPPSFYQMSISSIKNPINYFLHTIIYCAIMKLPGVE
jgi:hypothetical protein